ncbi:MAG: YbjN domain-containing protein [Microcoleaceae cyanobacterium]
MTAATETSRETMEADMNDGLISYSEEIETVIAGLAQDQKVIVGQKNDSYLWKFQYGSVQVFVQLSGATDDDSLTVWSPVLKLPAKNEAQLMQKLLEMNWLATFESHFAINSNEVVVISTRTLMDISPAEISRIITVVASIADDNDDDLIAEFGQ